jgi:putative tryptophan/tyrosine transport system substrate-binding protein
MRRREFISVLASAVAWPLASSAQQPANKTLRVGTVSGDRQSSPQWATFVHRMADLGYQEGRNFTFDFVPVSNDDDFEAGYRTLAAHKPDIIIAPGPEIALKSALAATRTLPIVMIAIDFRPATSQACLASRSSLQRNELS